MQLNISPGVRTLHNSLSMHLVTTLQSDLEEDGSLEPSGCDLLGKQWTLDITRNTAHAAPPARAPRPPPSDADMAKLRLRARRHIEALEHRTPLTAPDLATRLGTTPQVRTDTPHAP